MRALALGGAIGPALFTVVTVVVSAFREDYSHVHNFISELGATGTPHAELMNYAGFVPSGLMLLAFAVSTRALVPRSGLAALGTLLLALFGAGVVTAGLFACDLGCPQGTGSLANRVHDQVSPLAFLAALAAIGAFGVSFRGRSDWKPLWGYSLATAFVGVLFMIALIQSLETRFFTGLWQRLLLASIFLWCGTVGLRLYGSAGGEGLQADLRL
jgi:hypothetical membrane protein